MGAEDPGAHDAAHDAGHVAGHTTEAYVVEHGDTLEELAAKHYGDPTRWPEIFKASSGITQPNGRHITNPDLILPGYTVHIPHQHTVGDPAADPQGTTTPATPHQDAPPRQHPEPSDPAPHNTASATPVSPTAPAQPVTPAQPSAPAHSTAPAAQEPAPAASGDTSPDPASSDHTIGDHTRILSAPWVVPSLAGGAVLSAALLLTLRRRRREQFRARRPGRAIALPPPELAPYEKTFIVAGHPMEKSIEFLNTVLRQLALDLAAAHQTAPPVAAVELTATSATLHLTEPTDLPDPWIGSPDKLRWTAISQRTGRRRPAQRTRTIPALGHHRPRRGRPLVAAQP